MFMFAIKLLHLWQAQGIVGGNLNRPMGIEQLTSGVARVFPRELVASAFAPYLVIPRRNPASEEQRQVGVSRKRRFASILTDSKRNCMRGPVHAAAPSTAPPSREPVLACAAEPFATKQRSMAVTLLVLAAAVLFVAAVAYFTKHGR